MVSIHIAGHNDFHCPVGWTVEQAENKIRSSRVLIGGEIERNGEAMASNDTITSEGDYHFINFQPHQTQVALSDSIILKEMKELKEGLQTVALTQHVMNERLPKITEVYVTPSEYKKSKHKETFMDLMEMLGFGREKIINRVEESSFVSNNSSSLDFSFNWSGKEEVDSYEPLINHLRDKQIHGVRTDLGQGLPDALLYFEYLWTLKKNTAVRSSELRLRGEEPVFKYTLAGRTDIVVKADPTLPLGKSNNRYFIEIKGVQDFTGDGEECLREAVLELIGGNASNSFHSPPVLLTNLFGKHYVLFITLIGNPTIELKFKLNVLKMPSFGTALAFVEERTKTMKSETLHLGRRPTPPASPDNTIKKQCAEEDITERFANATLEEAVDD